MQAALQAEREEAIASAQSQARAAMEAMQAELQAERQRAVAEAWESAVAITAEEAAREHQRAVEVERAEWRQTLQQERAEWREKMQAVETAASARCDEAEQMRAAAEMQAGGWPFVAPRSTHHPSLRDTCPAEPLSAGGGPAEGGARRRHGDGAGAAGGGRDAGPGCAPRPLRQQDPLPLAVRLEWGAFAPPHPARPDLPCISLQALLRKRLVRT